MSSISFPHAAHDHTSAMASSAASLQDDEYFNSFSSASTSSFQMNPLSPHPPRTPRTSIVSNNHVYGGDIYTPKEEVIENQPELMEEEAEEAMHKQGQPRARATEVWREMLKTSYGRDKAFKILQYTMRLYLLVHTSLAKSSFFRHTKRPSWETEMTKRLEAGIAGFSLTRKCLILFNWLEPLTSIQAQHNVDVSLEGTKAQPQKRPLLHTFLHASPPTLLELVNGVSDDVATLSRLGLIGKRTGERAAYYADWCWFMTTLVNLVENGVERSMIIEQQHQVESRAYTESLGGSTAKSNPTATKLDQKELGRLQRKDYWILMSRWKLLMDLIFVSYNVFNFKRYKGPVQTLTGLAAAFLSTSKAYERHRLEVLKTVKA
ncbi:peroxisomal biogenesis factor 11 family protein [Phanerochaete sordida]|uniref:Peroxisomal biogenesis factor 11 family protein n=1 Tax=Phanerochaete sordida TaxID=48140 RepID=A0A9P3FYS9_9APHY|nr:peroxisomal biogenesis factor 11 family protein [Phanerochaete sordida]